MWLFVLEALLALALLLFIVWWTIAPVHKRESESVEREAHASGERTRPPLKPPR